MLFKEEKAQPFFLAQLQLSQLITQKIIEDAIIYIFFNQSRFYSIQGEMLFREKKAQP